MCEGGIEGYFQWGGGGRVDDGKGGGDGTSADGGGKVHIYIASRRGLGCRIRLWLRGNDVVPSPLAIGGAAVAAQAVRQRQVG